MAFILLDLWPRWQYCSVNDYGKENEELGNWGIVIILGVFDKRTNREGAIAGMSIGLAFTIFYIIGVKFYGMEPWFFGISPEGIGTLGMVLNFLVTYTVSRLTPPPPAEIQKMVELLRIPEDVPPALADLGEEELD